MTNIVLLNKFVQIELLNYCNKPDELYIGWINYNKCNNNANYTIVDEDKKCVGNTKFLNGFLQIWINYILYGQYERNIWSYKIIKTKNNNYCLSFTFNDQNLKKYIDNLLPIDIEIINYLCLNLKDNVIIDFDNIWRKPNIVDIPIKSLCQPSNLKLQLRKYQLKTLNWMCQVENCLDNNIFNFVTSTNMSKIMNCQDFLNLNYSSLTKKVLYDPEKLPLYSKGGILADEMGLGKTITTIGLILKRPYYPHKLQSQDKKINIKANLVICPNHLTNQWKEEIKRCNSKLKIILILTKHTHSKINYDDIINADIVIVSLQFLINKNYYVKYKLDSGYNKYNLNTYRFSYYHDILQKNNINNLLTESGPILEHFNWYRLILDEGHEIFNDISTNGTNNYLRYWLMDISTKYKWYLSGTPFVSKEGFISAMRYLDLHTHYKKDCKIDMDQLERDYLITNNFINQVFKMLYYRNTKQSVGNEYDVPSIIEEVITLELTPIEKNIYNSHLKNGRLYLRQLCCHPQISDKDIEYLGTDEITSLEDARERIIANKQQLLKDTERKLRVKLMDIGDDNARLLSNETSLTNLRNKISELKYIINVFTNLDPMTTKIDDICSICMCDFDDTIVTKCGHYFCKECISIALSNKKTCPTCRGPLSYNEVYSVAKVETKESNIDSLTFKYGSKLGKLIGLCKQLTLDENNRIIIFSQWDRMLHMIGRTLIENNIQNVYCKGNVYQRNLAIQRFKNGTNKKKDPLRIIMLSTEHAASGTNLTEATHIIMVDPVDGSREYIKSVRGQAIGRAVRLNQTKQVRVIDLIVKNTIEEEIYNNSIGD